MADPAKYRSKEELNYWLKKDPIKSFEKYLIGENICTKDELKKIIDIRYIQDNFLVPFEMSGGVLKIAIADASKLGLMKNLKTMTKMEPELYAATLTDINDFIDRMSRQDIKKISSSNVKVEKIEFSKLFPIVNLKQFFIP